MKGLMRIFSVICLILGCLIIGNIVFNSKSNNNQITNTISSQASLPMAVPTTVAGQPLTQTTSQPTATPTLEALQPASAIPAPISTTANLPSSQSISPILDDKPSPMTAPLHAVVWAPTGDHILYVTNAGDLFYANPDGTQPSLLHTYDIHAMFSGMEDQSPMTNTLLLAHHGTVNHLDVLSFIPGQPPILTQKPLTSRLYQIRWWATNRASGIIRGKYVGGERLVTFDETGNIVAQRIVPYMQSGAVQPGGQWLAYATNQQNTKTPLYGSDPQTVYLLNLSTGQRLQVTQPGLGVAVHSWSPDGRWFVMDAVVNNALQGVLVSADASQEIIIAPSWGHGIYNGAWSRDSTKLAFSVQTGGQDEPNSPSSPYANQVYVATLGIQQSAQVVKIDIANVMQPSWAPDGTLTVLNFDEQCTPWPCSAINPAFHQLKIR